MPRGRVVGELEKYQHDKRLVYSTDNLLKHDCLRIYDDLMTDIRAYVHKVFKFSKSINFKFYYTQKKKNKVP